MTPKLVIFDIDGTLVDSIGHIVAMMERAFVANDIAPPPVDAIKAIIGRSLDLAIAELLDGPETRHAPKVADTYRDIFREETAMTEARFFPGALDLVRDLSTRDDVLLGIATGKARRGLDIVFGARDLYRHFHTVQTSDIAPSKPDPGMIERAMAEAGTGPHATVMVGDSALDMAMARAAGVSAIGVAWGAQTPADLDAAGAHAIVSDFVMLGRTLDVRLTDAMTADG